MDITKEVDVIMKESKSFNYLLGKKHTKFWLYDFKHPIKKKKFEKTVYYFFKAKIIERDGIKIEADNQTIQLPSKTIVLGLYNEFIKRGILDEPMICISITRDNIYNYKIEIVR